MRVLVLGESNSQMVSLTDELSQKNEELLRHQEEIAQLLSQIVELQHRVKEVRSATPGASFLQSSDDLLRVCVCVFKCFCCLHAAGSGEGGAEDPPAGLQRCSETADSRGTASRTRHSATDKSEPQLFRSIAVTHTCV